MENSLLCLSAAEAEDGAVVEVVQCMVVGVPVVVCMRKKSKIGHAKG